MDLIRRIYYKSRAEDLLRQFPVMAILGPRQCGKTTFTRSEFPDFDYIDLELPSDFAKIEADPEFFLKTRKRPIVIDEAQRFPELFSILRSLVDRNRGEKGKYILLGSASFALQKHLSESLSGRIGFMDLPPFMLWDAPEDTSIDSHWLKGGFPDAFLRGVEHALSFEWFESYSRTLIERDLPALGIEVSSAVFRKLWMMCVHFHSSILNMNKIASSLGISVHTVSRYLDILEQTFMIRRLQPFHCNIKKRLVKSPKLYFRDSGLFHYFAQIGNWDELVVSPHRGDSFEGYVLEHIIQSLQLVAKGWQVYYFRTSDGLEVDLLLVKGKRIIAFEVKAKTACSKDDIKSLLRVIPLLNIEKAYVVSFTEDEYRLSDKVECIGAAELRGHVNHMLYPPSRVTDDRK